ncbi:hypothetical protein [Endozoicomonas numazuensis]|uniref:DUF4124 domain-containing protein n=1 Tax=Endozoicomonas numazuensis TaxID=1137799 RepID=A0A081NGX0_9GAMM|nr:hypothetical protein [Endozoicomonas numazuensis]KEQ17693.1 hypothetical protein GZ78_08340 [Endozoicomonas numazuensis]
MKLLITFFHEHAAASGLPETSISRTTGLFDKLYLRFIAACLAAMTFSAPVMAQNLYRYLNDQGNLVIATRLPSDQIDKGYEMIDKHGRVIKIISPKLDAEQQAALVQEEARLESLQSRRERDIELMRLYSSPEEARSALQRKVSEMQIQIELLEGTSLRLKNTLNNKRQVEEGLKNNGKAIPVTLSEEITVKTDRLNLNEQRISHLKEDLEKVRTEFHANIQRLEDLLRQKHLQEGVVQQPHINENLLSGDWQTRNSFWLDWSLSPDGTFKSRQRVASTGKFVEKTGTWTLDSTQLIFLVKQKFTTDSLGKIKKRRVSEEIQSRILEADTRSIVVMLEGSSVTLTRP